MKKNVTIICLVASLVLILDTIGAWHMFMMFLFVGVIPGTNIALSPTQMIIIIEMLAGAVFMQVCLLPIMDRLGRPTTKPSQRKIRRLNQA